MKIIDRYIIREFLKVFAICVAGFILVFLLVEITDKIKYYFQHNPSGRLMLKFFLVKIPGYLFFAIPLSILLGGMLSLLMMARHSEVIAMQANGIDALTIARPVLLVGAVAGVVMFLLNESVVPWCNHYAEYIQEVEIAGKKSMTVIRKDRIWTRSADSVTHIRKFDPSKNLLEDVSIIRWNPQYRFVERIHAEKAKWWDNRWVLYGVNRTVVSPEGRFIVESVPSMVGGLDRNPGDFGRVERLAKEMNLVQLGEYIDGLEKDGQIPTRYLVDWHNKLAFPFVCLIMAALSVPFAVRARPRGGGVALGLAVSMAVAFSYWVVHTLFIALGHGGYVPPLVAAWGANLIFGLTATILLLQAGT